MTTPVDYGRLGFGSRRGKTWSLGFGAVYIVVQGGL